MFLFEQWQDGFILTVEGRRILHHRKRYPALFVLRPRETRSADRSADQSEGLAEGRPSASKPDAPLVWKALHSFSIVNENAESRLLRFGETILIRFFYASKVLRCQFKVLDPAVKGLRLVLGAEIEEMLFGLGGYCQEAQTHGNLKGLKIRTECAQSAGLPDEPVVFSSRNWWIQTDRKACPEFDFQHDKTMVTMSPVPDELLAGFGAKPASALVLLTSHKLRKWDDSTIPAKKRFPLPGWVFEGAVLQKAAHLNPDTLKPLRTAAVITDQADETGTARAVNHAAWNHLLTVSAVRLLDAQPFFGKKADNLVRQILANSFSGVGYQSLTITLSQVPDFLANHGSLQAPSAAQESLVSFLARILDMSVFSPLLAVDLGGIAERAEQGSPVRHFLKNLARASELHAKLAEYHEYCSYLWQSKGLPVCCHPAVFYPEEKVLWNFDDAYLYGSDVLIAPSLPDDGRTRQLFLPDDEWVHLWTSRNFPGGVAVVDAPLGRPAVFYRKNSAFAGLFDELRKIAVKLSQF